MASINQRGGKLFFDFRWQGKRRREYTTLADTPANRKRAQAVLKHLDKALADGTFIYREYFPDSPQAHGTAPYPKPQAPHAAAPAHAPQPGAGYPAPGHMAQGCAAGYPTTHAGAHPGVPGPDTGFATSPSYPSTPLPIGRMAPAAAPHAALAPMASPLPRFDDFAEAWFAEMQPQWRRSYRDNLRLTLNAYLVPTFGHYPIDTLTKSDILSFRATLTKPSPKRPKGLSPSRVNHILCLLKMVVDEAAERYGFATPYRGIKPLRIPRTEVQPFTLEEIRRILETVRKDFRPYYTVRFFTGLRTAEADGLQWRYVDLERRQLVVAKTWVNGHVEDTKTAGSYRTVDLSPRVVAALEEQKERTGRHRFVFCNDAGEPLKHRQVTNKVWYPLLRSLGLEKRRPYQTRHTAATLWLAAGENPEWIAQQLGHSAQMLFDTYARYVRNLTRQDGSAFEALLNEALPADETGTAETDTVETEPVDVVA